MRFLVATDGSSQSEAAIEHAIEIADATDASLTAVHAVDPNVYEDPPDEPITDFSDAERRLVTEDVEQAEQRGRRILDDAVEIAEEKGFDLRTELVRGDPVEAVPTYAAENDVDGIFVGHRDISKDHERALGSVAKGLIGRASVPVTVVN